MSSTQTSCAPASSLPADQINVAYLGDSNYTVESSFVTCCSKVNGAYIEDSCYSRCYFYNSAIANRLSTCFLDTLDNPHDPSLDFRMFTNNAASASVSGSAAVITLVPVTIATTSSNATSSTASFANSSSILLGTGTTSRASAGTVTATAIISNGTFSNSTTTGIVTATGSPSVTPPSPPSTTAPAPAASSSKHSGSMRVTTSLGTLAIVGLVFSVLF